MPFHTLLEDNVYEIIQQFFKYCMKLKEQWSLCKLARGEPDMKWLKWLQGLVQSHSMQIH